MNIVFIHPNFPGQFRYLLQVLAKDEKNKTVFITTSTVNKDMQIKGVQKILIAEKSKEDEKEIKPLANPPALPVANVLAGLKRQEFQPDIIIGSSGSAMTFHVKDVFPDIPFLCFFEWYHNPSLLSEENEKKSDLKLRMNMRSKNMPVLADLVSCSAGICPTRWQKKQFPREFHKKLAVVHSGIDTQLFKPEENKAFKTEGLDLSGVDRIVTYTASLLAPYKGFDQFLEAIPMVLKAKPDTHFVLMASDRVSFGDREGNKKSYKEMILEKKDLNSGQVHFVENLTLEEYQTLLQVSKAHVYLDSPLVVSKALLEAMSCQCLVIAPDIPSVKEVIADGGNGFLADFSRPEKICEKIIGCIDYPSMMEKVKQKARQGIVENFSLERSLPKQMKIINTLLKQKNGQKKDSGTEAFG